MVFEKEYVGTMDIADKVDITDPCYDKGVWCRMNDVQVLAGKWTCNIWYDGVKNRVAIIGIYHEKYVIPKQRDMKKIGEIGVDTGAAGFFHDKPNFNDEEWEILCEYMRDGKCWLIEVRNAVCVKISMRRI